MNCPEVHFHVLAIRCGTALPMVQVQAMDGRTKKLFPAVWLAVADTLAVDVTDSQSKGADHAPQSQE